MSYPPPVPFGGGQGPANMQHALTMIASTTNVTELVQTVAEAYRLTVSLDRDIIEIQAHYRALEQSDQQLHEQIMLALEGQFTQRADQIAFVERIANRLIDEGQYDAAYSIISQLMTILQQSPVAEAFSKRRP